MGITPESIKGFVVAVGAGTQVEDLSDTITVQENDIAVVALSADGGLDPSAGNEGGINTGESYNTVNATGASTPGRQAAWKRLGAGETTVTINRWDTATEGGTQAGVILILRGVDQTTALDVTPPAASNGGAGMPDPPAITPVTDGAGVVIIGHLDDDNAESGASAPTNYTGTFLAKEAGVSGGDSATTLIAFRVLATAAPEDPGAFGGSGSDAWNGITIAFRPAAEAGGNTASGASTLPSIASSAQATLVPDGSGASVLPSIQQSGAVEEKFLASGAQALPAIQQNGQAFFGPDIAGAQALPAIQQSGQAALILDAAGAQTLPAIVQNAVAELILAATGAMQLPSILSSGVGFLLPDADGAQTLPSLLTNGSVSVSGEAVAASGASLLPAIVSQASGELILIASGASMLPSIQQQGSLEEILAAAGASILPSIQSEGSGAFGPDVAGASMLPSIQANAVLVLELPGIGACILPAIRTEGNAFLVPDAAGAMVLPSIRQLAIAELVGAVVKKEGQVSLLQRLSQNRLSWRF